MALWRGGVLADLVASRLPAAAPTSSAGAPRGQLGHGPDRERGASGLVGELDKLWPGSRFAIDDSPLRGRSPLHSPITNKQM